MKSAAAQNRQALARREARYEVASSTSIAVAWDYRKREPRDLREVVHAVRTAYADEVPTRLHEGPDSIGEGGVPKMHPAAEGYIFGNDQAGHDTEAALDFYRTPFRAALANWQYQQPKRAAIVAHVSIGSQGPIQAAVAEGVPQWCARIVAEDTLRAFLRSLTDVKVRLPKRIEAA